MTTIEVNAIAIIVLSVTALAFVRFSILGRAMTCNRCQIVNKSLTILSCPDEGAWGALCCGVFGNGHSRSNFLFVAPPSRSAAGRHAH
jgi:hypothetical protein